MTQMLPVCRAPDHYGRVSANAKMGEIARMQLTRLKPAASCTRSPWRRRGEIVKGGRSERDL